MRSANPLQGVFFWIIPKDLHAPSEGGLDYPRLYQINNHINIDK